MAKNIMYMLREASMQATDIEKIYLLRQSADQIDVALRQFTQSPSDDTLGQLTGAWAKGHRVLADHEAIRPSPGGGGAMMEGARLAA